MRLLRKYQQRKEKFRIEYSSKYPSLYNKITSINDFDYLNLIDRTFYIIKLREQFYSKHQDVLGVEYADYETDFTTDDLTVSFREKDYTFEDYINSLDRRLIDQIAENLKFIVEFYDLDPLNQALQRPAQLLLSDPNLFTISPFLFSLKDWFKILQNDISKFHGKPKTLSNQGYRNSEPYISLKIKFRMFSTELEKRIGTSEVKNYNVLLPPTIKIETDVLDSMIRDLKFNELIGTSTFDIKIKEIIVENKRRELRSLLKFHHDKKKLFTIFCLWLQLKKDKDQKDREKIRLFVNFFHSQTGDNESPTIPDLSFLDHSLYDFLSILRYLKDYKTSKSDLINFKVNDLFDLLPALKLATQVDSLATFRDRYYKKTDFPSNLEEKIKHHLH